MLFKEQLQFQFLDLVADYSNFFVDMPREQLRPEIHFESLMLLTEKIVALKQKRNFARKGQTNRPK